MPYIAKNFDEFSKGCVAFPNARLKVEKDSIVFIPETEKLKEGVKDAGRWVKNLLDPRKSAHLAGEDNYEVTQVLIKWRNEAPADSPWKNFGYGDVTRVGSEKFISGLTKIVGIFLPAGEIAQATIVDKLQKLRAFEQRTFATELGLTPTDSWKGLRDLARDRFYAEQRSAHISKKDDNWFIREGNKDSLFNERIPESAYEAVAKPLKYNIDAIASAREIASKTLLTNAVITDQLDEATDAGAYVGVSVRPSATGAQALEESDEFLIIEAEPIADATQFLPVGVKAYDAIDVYGNELHKAEDRLYHLLERLNERGSIDEEGDRPGGKNKYYQEFLAITKDIDTQIIALRNHKRELKEAKSNHPDIKRIDFILKNRTVSTELHNNVAAQHWTADHKGIAKRPKAEGAQALVRTSKKDVPTANPELDKVDILLSEAPNLLPPPKTLAWREVNEDIDSDSEEVEVPANRAIPDRLTLGQLRAMSRAQLTTLYNQVPHGSRIKTTIQELIFDKMDKDDMGVEL